MIPTIKEIPMTKKTAPKKRPTRTDLMRAIRRREAAFQKMTPEQKRVAIAKDVLASIRSKRITPEKGTYLEMASDKQDPFGYETPLAAQVRDLVVGGKCTACAVGSMFLCAVERHDDLTVAEASDRVDISLGMKQFLARFFDYDQIALIESAFERAAYLSIESGRQPPRAGAAILFGRAAVAGMNVDADYRKCARVTMRAIMENIVENGGTFVP